MEFIVNGELKDITIVDANGVEYTADVILESTNCGGAVYNEDTMDYSMDEKSYLYWSDMSKKMNKISEMYNELSPEEKEEYLSIGDGSLDDVVAETLAWLEEKQREKDSNIKE